MKIILVIVILLSITQVLSQCKSNEDCINFEEEKGFSFCNNESLCQCKEGFYGTARIEDKCRCPSSQLYYLNALPKCMDCTNGQVYFNNSDIICAKCTEGKLYFNNGFPECIICPNGTIVFDQGFPNCIPCIGRVYSIGGNHICLQCKEEQIYMFNNLPQCFICNHPNRTAYDNYGNPHCIEKRKCKLNGISTSFLCDGYTTNPSFIECADDNCICKTGFSFNLNGQCDCISPKRIRMRPSGPKCN